MEIALIVLAVAVIALVVAAAVFYVRAVRAKSGAETELREAGEASEAKVRDAEMSRMQAEAALEAKSREAEAALQQAEALNEAALRHAGEVYEAKLKAKDDQIESQRELYEAKLKAKDEYTARIEAAHAEASKKADEVHAEAMRRMEAQQEETLKKIDAQHAKDMEMMQAKFTAAANEILNRNTKDFSEKSAEKIDTLLKPVREKFDELKQKVDVSDRGRVALKTSLEEQIKAMVSQTTKVSASADNLANALTSRSKTQGDFGELILKDILVNANLKEGIHFICQGVMTDDNGHEIKSVDGRTMIPDVQVLYPDNTVVIVDSKVSLTDYVAYCSATDESAKKAALKRHVDSIRRHVNELSDKDYTSYLTDGKRKVDYNIMFIPNDGAFIDMMDADPRLWQDACDRRVLIVSQMTLVIVLNMIFLVWKQSEREKNVDAIVGAASELMGQIQGWLDKYEDIGDKIKKLSDTYDEATKKLTTSPQSVVSKVRKLENLHVAPKRSALKASSRKAGRESVIPASLSNNLTDTFFLRDGSAGPDGADTGYLTD